MLPIACGRESATMPLHLTKFSPATSLLRPTALHIPGFPSLETEDTIEVKVERLDHAVRASPLVRAPYLLKIDVQGFEWEVLQGAIGILPDVAVILCEVNAVPFYAGQAGLSKSTASCISTISGWSISASRFAPRQPARFFISTLLFSRPALAAPDSTFCHHV